MKNLIKKVERIFFNLLRFDLDGYSYKKPTTKNQKKLHSELIDSYFRNQPGIIRSSLIKIYLFLKKGLLFAVRRLLRKRRV